MHCPIGGVSKLSCCLSDGFLLVSVLVSFTYVGQDLLFYACQFHSFQGIHCKELWSKEDNVLIVKGSIPMISSPRQYVWFAHSTSGAVMKQEVESSQMQGPMSLTMVKFFDHHKILEVLVVSPDFHQIDRSFQKVPPLF